MSLIKKIKQRIALRQIDAHLANYGRTLTQRGLATNDLALLTQGTYLIQNHGRI
jgi:hypothetical protein